MYAKAHAHLELEIIKWIVLLVLASALVLGLASRVGGQEPVVPTPAAPVADPYLTAVDLWRVIGLHEAKELEAARGVWESLELPAERDAWRWVALGAIHLRAGRLDAALDSLANAATVDPANPLTPFHRGLVRLKQAAAAKEFYDAIEMGRHIFVSVGPDDDRVEPTYSRGMYLRMADEEFARACELAKGYDLGGRLLDVEWVVPTGHEYDMPLAVPTVRHLLAALDVEDFHARAHLDMGKLAVVRGSTEEAERRLEEAAKLGADTREAYRDLGRRYELLGRPLDALRAHLRGMRGPAAREPNRTLVEDFGDLFRRG